MDIYTTTIAVSILVYIVIGNYAGRSVRKTEELADNIKCKSVDWVFRHQIKTDVLVNATPVGKNDSGQRLPVSLEQLTKTTIVADVVYNPPDTWLMRTAANRECPTIDGLTLLIEQAALGDRS